VHKHSSNSSSSTVLTAASTFRLMLHQLTVAAAAALQLEHSGHMPCRRRALQSTWTTCRPFNMQRRSLQLLLGILNDKHV
jgi:hypothetical protein